MPDRRWVVYKTPLTRFTETVLILLITVASVVLWRVVLPDVSISYPLVVSLVAGFAVVPAIGARVALRRGAPLMSPEERSRRYLDEITPIGLGRHGILRPASTGRRPRSRGLRR
ncbi:MAG TPA: hypothetical protein VKS60_11635 [Stellaceae bacterium]|nr:hypothetical protein [Stellaceae bacterium]